jgi:hypothetical protein
MWRYVERVGGIYGIKVRICHRINVLGGRNGNPEIELLAKSKVVDPNFRTSGNLSKRFATFLL